MISTSTEYEATTYSAEYLKCPKFHLKSDEFELKEDGSAYVKTYDKVFEVGHFEHLSETGLLAICTYEGTLEGNKFSVEMGYVTLICLGVSIICCVLHIVASILVPELQNLSGIGYFLSTRPIHNLGQ